MLTLLPVLKHESITLLLVKLANVAPPVKGGGVKLLTTVPEYTRYIEMFRFDIFPESQLTAEAHYVLLTS